MTMRTRLTNVGMNVKIRPSPPHHSHSPSPSSRFFTRLRIASEERVSCEVAHIDERINVRDLHHMVHRKIDDSDKIPSLISNMLNS